MTAPSAALSINTLVLLPGMDGTGELFSRFVGEFAAPWDFRVVRYPATAASGYDGLIDTVRAALPTDRPYALLAESFSGPLGIAVAAEAPIGLARLVLCCTFARSPRPVLRPLRPLLPLAPLDRMPVSVLGRLLMGWEAEPDLQRSLAASLAQVPAAVLRSRLQAVMDVDVTSALARVTVPVLCLRATRDWCVPRGSVEWISRHLPQAQVAAVDGPHFLLQTKAARTAAIVQQFIAS